MLKTLHTYTPNPIRYADSKGELVLREALAMYYHHNGYAFVKPDQMIITVGGSEACVYAFFATCSPGDEVLVFEPYYANYATCAAFVDVKLKAIPTSVENGYHLPEGKTIEKYITPKTKAILFCSPGNPTGTVYTKKEMEMLVAIAKKHNLFLLSDEVYREFTYEDTSVSMLSFIQELPDQIIILDSLSKRYSLCGARVGVFLSLNDKLMQGITKLAQGRLSAGLIDQHMAAKLNEVPASWISEVVSEYKKRRDIIYEGLSTIPGVKLSQPEGAFYTMVTLPVADAEDFCKFLLEDFRVDNATVMLAPGNGFYQNPDDGKTQVRLAYVLNEIDLKKSMEILQKGLEAYKKKS
jgi:aspartate aminotransferase